MSSPRKTMKAWAKLAAQQGWRVVPTANGHAQWFAPDGVTVITASASGDPRALQNHAARLRRAGFVFPDDAPREEPAQVAAPEEPVLEALTRTG